MMRSKVKWFLTITIGILLLFYGEAIGASSGTDGDISWSTYDSKLTITSYYSSGSVGIATMNDYSVAGGPWNDNIRSVEFKGRIGNVGRGAFKERYLLNSVELPVDLSIIGYNAFSRCESLEKIYFTGSNSVYFESSAFYGCKNVNEIHIPSLDFWLACRNGDSPSLYAYPNCAASSPHLYVDDTEITEIVFPENTTSIRDYAFAHCIGITSITMPESITSIGYDAFGYCTNISNIYIPSIESWMAWSNTGETPNKHSNSSHLFIDGNEVTDITIPDGITSIGDYAFSSLKNLKSVSIPDTVTSIGRFAFSNCDGLESIYIPDSVTSIDYYAFIGCDNLTDIRLPENLTVIHDYTFGRCTSLSNIVIPHSVNEIDKDAFTDSDNIRIETQYCTSYALEWAESHQIPAVFLNHQNYIKHDKVEATCTDDGLSAYWECLSCGEKYADENASEQIDKPQVIPAIGHIPVADEELLSTCDKEGHTAGTHCETCGLILSGNDTIEKLPHTVVIDPAVSPADTETGLTEGSHCGVCNEILVPQQTVPAIWGFETNDDGITITGYTGSSSRINVPASLNGINVVAIANSAFGISNCPEDVFIPRSIEAIGETAFAAPITVYCHKYSEADFWADEVGYSKVYVDNVDTGDFYTITMPPDFRLECGQSQLLDVLIWPLTGTDRFIWESSDPEIVSVESGVCTALDIGSATITLYAGGKSASVDIQAWAPPSDFHLSRTNVYAVSGEKFSLSIIDIVPEKAEMETVWSVSNSRYAEVDQNGEVTPKRIGEAIIYVTTQNSIVRECAVTICYPVESISLDDDNYSILLGDTFPLVVNVSDGNRTFVNELVSFTSSDTGIAKVDDTGLVTGVSFGTVTITIAATSGVKKTVDINILCPGHVPVTDSAVAPTCTEPGLSEGSHCEICGAVLVAQNVVGALGHKPVIDAAVAPTCTTSGLTEGSHCERCETVLVTQETIDPLGHLWSDVLYTLSDDKKTVTARRVCERNDQHVEEQTVSAMGTVTRQPTCTDKGITTYTSDDFDNTAFTVHSFPVEDLDPTGHALTGYEQINPTCTEEGKKPWWVCSNCKKVFADESANLEISEPESINALGHTLTEHVKVDATCTEEGTKEWWDCSVCKKLFADSEAKDEIDKPETISALGHDWSVVSYTWNGNNTQVTAARSCTRNAQHIQSETVDVVVSLISPKEDEPGMWTGAANFIASYFSRQEKVIEIPPLLSMDVLYLPDQLLDIEDDAFTGIDCEAVILPNNCQNIGENAFSNCKKLRYVYIPISVQFIPESAFNGSDKAIIDWKRE